MNIRIAWNNTSIRSIVALCALFSLQISWHAFGQVDSLHVKQFNGYPDSVDRLKNEWRYCGDPFLMDMACIDSIGRDMLLHPLIQKVRSYYGLRDIAGKENEPKILTFFKETGNYKVKTDEAAWCSVFLGYCAKNLGYQYSGLANARSWLSVGTEITTPLPGDVVIFWREKKESWKGHVTIYLGKNEETNEIHCLGGNQNDEVCILTYPVDTVLGYRRLNKKVAVSSK